jgi:hypothetical protein
MFAVSLHARFGDDPDFCSQIDLIPSGTDDLAGARRGQNRKFKGPGRDTFALPQLIQICRNLDVGQRRVMFDLSDLTPSRKQMIEVSSPSGRIFAGAEASDLRPIQNGLNPPA